MAVWFSASRCRLDSAGSGTGTRCHFSACPTGAKTESHSVVEPLYRANIRRSCAQRGTRKECGVGERKEITRRHTQRKPAAWHRGAKKCFLSRAAMKSSALVWADGDPLSRAQIDRDRLCFSRCRRPRAPEGGVSLTRETKIRAEVLMAEGNTDAPGRRKGLLAYGGKSAGNTSPDPGALFAV